MTNRKVKVEDFNKVMCPICGKKGKWISVEKDLWCGWLVCKCGGELQV